MYEIYFILGIMFIGIITSYTDIKYGIIKNKILLIGIIYTIILNLIIFFSLREVNVRAYYHYFTNSIFILILSFILWYVGLWTAGDAKLFFVFNLLTPPFFMDINYKGYFYGFTYFINIFGVLFIFLLYKVIRKIKKNEFIYSFKKAFSPKNVLYLSMFVFSFGVIFKYFPSIFLNNFFTMIVFFFLLYSILQFILGKKLIFLVIGIGLFRIYSEHEQMLTSSFWISFSLQLLFFILFRFFLLRLSYFAFTKKIKIDELKDRMFLAEDIIPVKVKELNETRRKELEKDGNPLISYQKSRVENLTFFEYLQNKYFKQIDYDKRKGLTEKNLEWFRKNRKRFLFDEIRVYETMPFAPIIFIGILISISIKGNIFAFIQILIRS